MNKKSGHHSLALVTLGIVFGDIGTSSLYTFKLCFHDVHGVPADPGNILGVVSLIIWSLVVVVSTKCLAFILRADNKGEGGLFALSQLSLGSKKPMSGSLKALVAIFAAVGAALFYGDGVITPSISVLSAMEGLQVATAVAQPHIVPLACIVGSGQFLAHPVLSPQFVHNPSRSL